MSGPTNQQNATLDYLFNASFSLVSTVPSLSSFYMKQLQTNLRVYELKNHSTLQKTCCSKCGTIKLPGINHKVEIKKRVVNTVNNKNDKKVNKPRKNQLVENCLACGHVKIYYGSQKKKLPKDTVTNQVKPAEKQQNQQQQQQNNKQPNKQQNQLMTEKKKKNKSKKNNLQALLSKQKEQKPSSSTGGSLNDFLSSL